MTKLRFMLKESKVNTKLLIILFVILLIYPAIVKGRFEQNMGILILMWACLGSAWNIFGGYTGQVSLGNAIFFGVGAYGSVVPYVKWNISPWIGMFIGMGLAIIVAVILAWPLFKLKAQYFAIATVALGETFRILAVNSKFVGGAAGVDILRPKASPWYAVQFMSKIPYYYFFLGILILVFLIMLYINSSKTGYYFRTIKANETAAASVGIDVRKYKTIAFIISACITSLCGTFYAQYQLYIDPITVFNSSISTRMIMMAVIGGLGTMSGPMLGALLLVPLSEYTRVNFASLIPGSDQVLFGALIILIILFQPKGLLEIILNIVKKVNGKKIKSTELGGDKFESS